MPHGRKGSSRPSCLHDRRLPRHRLAIANTFGNNIEWGYRLDFTISVSFREAENFSRFERLRTYAMEPGKVVVNTVMGANNQVNPTARSCLRYISAPL
jgi:hypothetical protein